MTGRDKTGGREGECILTGMPLSRIWSSFIDIPTAYRPEQGKFLRSLVSVSDCRHTRAENRW